MKSSISYWVWPTERLFSAIVSRITGQGVSGRIGARRPFDKFGDWRAAGPDRTVAPRAGEVRLERLDMPDGEWKTRSFGRDCSDGICRRSAVDHIKQLRQRSVMGAHRRGLAHPNLVGLEQVIFASE
jgi:hypothetical protein